MFNPESEDFTDYIENNSKLHEPPWRPNTEVVENRCVRMTLDKNAKYLMTFTMDTRF